MPFSTESRLALLGLYADYAACLDDGRLEEWPGYFTEDAHYKLIPRENYDRGMPLATMDLQGRGALSDRAYGVKSTLFYAPYYQRHIVGPVRITGHEEDTLLSEANYLVIRTKRDAPSEILNTGRYIDRVVATELGLRFSEKTCVFDSELIPNSIIYPI